MTSLPFTHNDGGRADAGFKGDTGDCVVRAIAIASGRPYREVYDRVQAEAKGERRQARTGRRSGARTGVFTQRKWFKDYMAELGFVWTPTMGIGSGCTVHLAKGELPMGRLVVSVSRHSCAVIDGVIHDAYDPGRDGMRCVYGYWALRLPPTILPEGEEANSVVDMFAQWLRTLGEAKQKVAVMSLLNEFVPGVFATLSKPEAP